MQSGRDTLRSIEDAASEVQHSVQQAQDSLNASNERRVELVEQRLSLYRELAEIKVKDALHDQIIDESDNLTKQVQALLEARLRTARLLNTELGKVREEHEAATNAYDALVVNIEACEGELDEAGTQAEAELENVEGYSAVKSEYEELQCVIKAAKEKAERAESDRHEKGAAYRNDPLFMYLWKRRYGTKNYSSNALFRQLDDWVADLISYSGARANYAVLLQIPDRLEDHVERLQAQLKKLEEKLFELKAEKIKEMAGDDLIGKLASLREDEAARNKVLEASNAALAEVTAQLNQYSEGKDHSFQQALKLTAEAIEQEDFADLLYEARQTEDPRDDQILEQLRVIDKELDHLEDVILDQRDELRRQFKRQQEMQRVATDFRRKRYDDPGVMYSNGPQMEKMLGMLLTGALTAAEYWAQSRRYRHIRRRPADPFRHQSHLPPFGGSFGGFDHDFGSSDFGDSDFDNDDFMTGGGF